MLEDCAGVGYVFASQQIETIKLFKADGQSVYVYQSVDHILKKIYCLIETVAGGIGRLLWLF